MTAVGVSAHDNEEEPVNSAIRAHDPAALAASEPSWRTQGPGPAVGQPGSTAAGRPGRYLARVAERAGSLWTLGVLVLIVICFGIASPNFFSQAAWVATVLAASSTIILGVGEAFVVIGRGIDLSVGANLGFSGMVAGWTMSVLGGANALPGWLIVAIGAVTAVVVGGLVGLVCGLVVTVLDVAPLIATLGVSGACTGATLLINNGQQISNLPPEIFQVGNNAILGGWLPLPTLVAAVIAVLAGLALHFIRFGRHCYGIGSNPEAAARTGIRVKRHTAKVFVLAGLLAGVAGFLVMGELGAATVTAGQQDTLSAIAAVVIGGVSLFGGRGHIAGAVIGALIITVLSTGLVVANVSSSWQVIAVGIVLIAAVFVDRQRVKIARRG
jgi:ribose transport system permease protein